MNWKNLIERAIWTAVQSFGATAIVDAYLGGDPEVGRALLVSVIAALFSGLKTIAQERLHYLERERPEEGADV